MARAVTIRALWVALGAVGCAAPAIASTTLSYDVIAAAANDTGNYGYYNKAYNAEWARSDPVTSDGAQSFSFSASVSGSNSYFVGYRAQNAASVDAAASIDYGLMRAKVYGTGSTDSILVNVQGQNNVWAAIDGGSITAATRDVLTFTSATLQPGAPVDVEVRVRFHAATGMTGGPADPTVWPGFTQSAPQASLSFNGALMTIRSWVNPEATFDQVYTYTRAVGDTLPLNFDLRVLGGLSALAPLGDISIGPFTEQQTSGFSDASATVSTSVRVLTPGAGYVAQSGTVYAVPGPATWVLWVGGMAAIGFLGSRSRAGATPRISN